MPSSKKVIVALKNPEMSGNLTAVRKLTTCRVIRCLRKLFITDFTCRVHQTVVGHLVLPALWIFLLTALL